MKSGGVRGSPLRVKLPLLVTGGVVAALALFALVSYRQVTATLAAVAEARAQGAAANMAQLFQQSARRRQTDVAAIAGQSEIRRFVATPTPQLAGEARRAFTGLLVGSQQHSRVEVWSASGTRLLAVESPEGAANLLPAANRPTRPGIQPIRLVDGRPITEVVAEVPGVASGQPPPAYVRLERVSTSTTNAALLDQLVGDDASVSFGNQEGEIWTDLTTAHPPPPVDRAVAGTAEYVSSSGRRVIASVQPIDGTPWAVAVEFPRGIITAQARPFLRELGQWMAGLLIVVLVLSAWGSTRLTRPLSELTVAAERIADGDYGRRVTVDRHDEIGRLASAFNRMVQNVESSRSEAEAHARELTVARESAELQNQLLELVLAGMRDGVVVADDGGRMVRFNPAAESILGLGAVDAPSDTWSQAYGTFTPDGNTLIPPDQLPLPMAVAGHSSDNIEILIRNAQRPHGVLINCYGRPLQDASGRRLGGVVIFEDVTVRRQTEQALRDRERDFRTLFANSPLAKWVYERHSLRFLEVNDAALRQYGYTREEFLAMSLMDIRLPEDHPSKLQERIETSDDGRAFIGLKHRLKSGDLIDVEIVTHDIRFDNHDAVIVVISDVTERLRAHRALSESEAITRAIVDGALDAIVSMNRDGVITDFNPAAERLFGHVRGDVVGKTLAEVLVPPSMRSAHYAGLTRYLATGERRIIGHHVELPAMRSDGSEFPVEIAVIALEGSGPLQFTAFIRDLTKQKAAEQALVRWVKVEEESRRAHEASRLKSEFLANMSHELRTPLNAIIGFSELMYDDQVSPEQPEFREFLRDILTSGRHLLKLINDVLDLSKVEAGRIEFHPEPVDLEETINEVLGILRTSAAEKQLRVATSVDPAVRRVTTDPSRFKQVLYNYISNALKFTPQGGRVSVRVRPEGVDYFRLEVEDTGIGIPVASIPKLFLEFQQLAHGASKTHQGTGLGLALTKRLVEAQGGSVGVDSAVGRGSVFHAVLPLVSRGSHPRLAPRSFPSPDPGAPCVLVIEDNEADQNVIVGLLTQAGYAVETATTGAQATAKLAERTFDGVTLDLLLPDGSGLDILRDLRQSERHRDVPVVVITVVAANGQVGAFAVEDVLTKPVDGARLLAALERAGVRHRDGDILVVDDDAGSLRLMAAALAQLGYLSRCVASGKEGLAAVAVSMPRAIILDLQMPEMDGFEFLVRFRQLPDSASTRIIIWTVRDLSAHDYEQLRASVQGIMAKGHDSTLSVVDELRRYLRPERAT